MDTDKEIYLLCFFKIMQAIFGKAEIKRDLFSFHRYYLGTEDKEGAKTIELLYKNLYHESVEDFATNKCKT